MKLINDNPVVPSIAGRLGNNMFMIANAYARALDENRQLIVPRYQVGHMEEFLPNIFRKLDVYVDMPDDAPKESMILSGYFQSETFFEKHSEAIKSLFSPTREFVKRMENEFSFLKTSRVTAVSVRRGDYLIYSNWHPVVTREYIDKALSYIDIREHHLIFSDDMEWCKQHLSHLGNVVFINLPPHEQMWLMSLCDDFVISNSSFSWWGAYLSRTKDKKVVAPETWFGPDGPKSWEDMYCKDWTVVPTYYENGFIHPR